MICVGVMFHPDGKIRISIPSWSVHPQIMSLSWVDYDRNQFVVTSFGL